MKPCGSPTLLCVEDDPRVMALVVATAQGRGITVTGCRTAAEALRAGVHPYSLAVVDLGLPDGSGLSVLEFLSRRHPGMPSLVLTVEDRPDRVLAALRAGASGYLLKDDLWRRLSTALDDVREGRMLVSARIAHVVRAAVAPAATDPPVVPVQGLTEAQVAVLRAFADGLSYEATARRLGITVNTVRTHVRAVYAALGVDNKTDAVMSALKAGILTAP